MNSTCISSHSSQLALDEVALALHLVPVDVSALQVAVGALEQLVTLAPVQGPLVVEDHALA